MVNQSYKPTQRRVEPDDRDPTIALVVIEIMEASPPRVSRERSGKCHSLSQSHVKVNGRIPTSPRKMEREMID